MPVSVERGARVVVTPLARRIALAHGVDLGSVAGTGPGGRICAADVRALVGAGPSAQPSGQPATVSAPRPVAASSRVPVATATFELDVTVALAAAVAAGRPWRPVGLTAVVAAAAAGLLPAFPELNAAWGGEAAVLRRRAHVAVAEGGRWAVVADAGDLTARGVARAIDAGAMGEATFAVVSLAEGASWRSAAPPLPGTTAALSLGAPARRAVALGEAVAVRPVATLTLSYDARLVDDRRAAAFLRALRERLEGGC